MEVHELKAWLDADTARCHVEQAEHKAADAMLQVAGAHATICNLENQELCCQLALSREDWDVQEAQNKHGEVHHYPP